MAPRKNAKKQDARPKRAKTNAAGHKNRKGKSKTSACGGVPCNYLSCLSLSQKKKRGNGDVGEKPKGRTKTTKKTPDLTSTEFFQDSFGSEKAR